MTPTTEQLKDLLDKVTPGDWRVEVDESAAQVKGYPCIEAYNYTIVGHEGMYGDIDTDFFNATLIALAPTLAAEVVRLRGALARIDRLTEEAPFDFGLIRLISRQALDATSEK